MSPLGPEAPTGPYRIEKNENERINKRHAEIFIEGRLAGKRMGVGDERKHGGLVEGNQDWYKGWLCSVLMF